MNNDELQVLGAPHDNKKLNKWVIAIIAILAIAIGTIFYLYLSSTRPEIVKSGKRMGDSTIVKELQKTVVKMLNDELTEIDGLQGQVEPSLHNVEVCLTLKNVESKTTF